MEGETKARARWGQAGGQGLSVPRPLPPRSRARVGGGAGVRCGPCVPIPRCLGRGPSSLLPSAPRPPLTSGLDWRAAGPGKFESRWGERGRRARDPERGGL